MTVEMFEIKLVHPNPYAFEHTALSYLLKLVCMHNTKWKDEDNYNFISFVECLW